MTLILAVGGPTFCFQVSDRRITHTTQSGRVVTVSDRAAKAILVHTQDARLVIGFTGLARAPGFATQDRILFHVRELGLQGVFQSLPIIHGLADRLTEDLARTRVSPTERRLSVLVSGFRQVHDEKQLSVGLISNFQSLKDVAQEVNVHTAGPECRVYTQIPPDPLATGIFPVGMTRSVKSSDLRTLRQALQAPGARFEDVVGLAVRAVVNASRDTSSRRTIGDSVMMTAVFSDGRDPTGMYYPAKPSSTVYFPDIVTASPDSNTRIRFGVEALDSSAALAVPPPTHRRAPCPCGSGKRFRSCHGNGRGAELIVSSRPRARDWNR